MSEFIGFAVVGLLISFVVDIHKYCNRRARKRSKSDSHYYGDILTGNKR